MSAVLTTVTSDACNVPHLHAFSLRLLYPPYPKDRGMLWFYVEAARRPPSAARRPPPAARRPPPAMVLTR